MQEILRELEERRASARQGGGEKRIAAQHAKGERCTFWDSRWDRDRPLFSS